MINWLEVSAHQLIVLYACSHSERIISSVRLMQHPLLAAVNNLCEAGKCALLVFYVIQCISTDSTFSLIIRREIRGQTVCVQWHDKKGYQSGEVSSFWQDVFIHSLCFELQKLKKFSICIECIRVFHLLTYIFNVGIFSELLWWHFLKWFGAFSWPAGLW